MRCDNKWNRNPEKKQETIFISKEIKKSLKETDSSSFYQAKVITINVFLFTVKIHSIWFPTEEIVCNQFPIKNFADVHLTASSLWRLVALSSLAIDQPRNTQK